jgi:outer membrane protein assembly factor BamB
MLTEKIAEIKEIISKEVFIKNRDQQIDILTDPDAWIFDFRKVLMNGVFSNLISDIFYEQHAHDYPFQICTIEIGGVPLATSIMNKFYSNGHADINSFFIRKSRKRSGLLRMIEGTIVTDKKIILVDDTMNSGGSFWRQVVALESLGYKIDSVWSIIRYRDHSYYKRFEDRGIGVNSLFTLDDFTEELGENIKNLVNKSAKPPQNPFIADWLFKAGDPSLNYVIGKSGPTLDNNTVYVGSDSEYFWAINQKDGSVKWKFKVGKRAQRKSIFSNPVLNKDTVIFGSYDGNVYALDKQTGKKRWVSFEGDYVGSSPAIAEDLEMVFIGLEFGLFKRHGGIVALNANTGETIWTDYSHSALTHCSPHYIESYQQVVIGSNDGIVRLYNAKTGKKLWEFTTYGGAKFNHNSDAGFGEGEIKESFVYDAEHDYIIFGATDGFLYILERATGHLVKHFKCIFSIWATPFLYKNKVYFSSLDKYLRCVDLETLSIVFEKNIDGTRIFCNPVVIADLLYIGTNAGRLHELNPETGESLGYFQTLERITNAPVYNSQTKLYYLPTYANEIICLKRKENKLE